MEILQTIWISLTTPNEGLIKIIFIPLSFLDTFIGMFFFSTILNISSTKKQKILYVCIMSILSQLSNFLLPTLYSSFVKMIIWPILVILIFKTSILKGILSEVVVLVITSCLDFILSKTLYLIFYITPELMLTIPLYRICITLFLEGILLFLGLFVKYFKLNIKVFDSMSKKGKFLLAISLLLIIIVIGMHYYLIDYYTETMPSFIIFINIASLIAYFGISIYSIVSSSKLEMTERDLEGANLTIHSLRVLHDTVRTFKHDFDNIINGIGGYISNKDMDGLTEYYNQLLQDCHKTNNLYSLSPDVINEPAIYNILATKYYVADELNIQIDLDIFLDLNEIEKHMKIYDFTRILGILLDNSIEASKDCEEKLIKVSFRKEETKHRIIIVIENTYNNKDVNIDNIFDKGISSKEGNTGLGLWKVRQILKRNNNLNLFTTKDDTFFKQQFEIYY